MSEESDSLILRCLRRIDAKIDRLIDNMDETLRQIGDLELAVAKCSVAIAELGIRLDRLDRGLTRIERRLDLIDDRAAS